MTTSDEIRELREEITATFAIWLVVLDVVHHAEETDSPALAELACLLAAMHAQLAAREPRLLTRCWGFVEALRDLHRAKGGAPRSLAGYLQSRGESLAALIAPTNLRAAPDGSVTCDSLGALGDGDVDRDGDADRDEDTGPDGDTGPV